VLISGVNGNVDTTGVKIIASIEDPAVIQKILAHLDNTARSAVAALLPDCRASPSLPAGLFD